MTFYDVVSNRVRERERENDCHLNATCFNTPGPYYCTRNILEMALIVKVVCTFYIVTSELTS